MPPRLVVVASILAVTLAPGMARADGDPASDVLLGANVFYPYSQSVSQAFQKTLNAETAAASRANFPIKVALIASPTDLGAIPSLFGHPQNYSDFLDQEITFPPRPTQLLLVVMPTGYGVQGLGLPATKAAASLAKPSGSQSNDLARAAIVALPKLAAAAGHPISIRNSNSVPRRRPSRNREIRVRPNRKASGVSTGNGSTTLIVAILGLAVIATAAVLIRLRTRKGRPADG